MRFEELSHMMQKPEPKPDTYEAGMAQNQLLKIGSHAIRLHNMIDDGQEMESWVAKKIDLASNYVKSVHGYTAGSKAGTYDDAGMSEGTDTTATDKEIKMAKGIAFDKRNKDNMSKATSTIEKVRKGLSDQPDVADALRTANEDAGDEQKWMNYAKFWKFVNEIFKDKAEEDISDQFINATTVDEEPSYSMSKELMQRQLKKQNTPFKINIDADLDEFSNELNGRYEDETDMAKMKQAAIEIIKTGSTQIEPVKNAGTLSTYVQEDAGEGHMSKSQLYQTAKMSIELLDMIRKGDDLEGWVQTKLNLAADYLQAVYHYEDYQKLNPYREDLDGQLMQKHAGVIQKNLDEILARETKTADVDTKPGMMRILKKRVNEVEKEIAKENRKNTDEGGMPSSVIKSKQKYANMSDEELADRFKGADEKTLRQMAWRHGYGNMSSHYLDRVKNVMTGKKTGTTEAELDEGIIEWGKRLGMAGVIVAGLAGVNTINNAIDNSVPAIKAMNTALEMANDADNDKMAQMIEKDLSDAKLRLSSGKDLSHVADLQEKYAKFMKTEGLAYESKLAVQLKQQLK